MCFLAFLGGGFFVTGTLKVRASALRGWYWRRSFLGLGLSGPCFGLFWLFAGFGSFGLLGPLPLSLPWPPWPSRLGLAGAFVFRPLRLSWPRALLSWAVQLGLALSGPSSVPSPFGLCVGHGFLPFCLGLCGLAWPSGGLFVGAATMGGGLPFVLSGCAARWGFGWWWRQW